MHFDISPIIPHTQIDQYTELPVMSSNQVNILLPRFEARMFIGETKLCGGRPPSPRGAGCVGGYYMLQKFPTMCVCVCIGFIYLIPFYILFEGGHVSLKCSEKKVFYLLKMDYLFLFLLKCVCIYAHVSMCARWPSFPCLVIFH